MKNHSISRILIFVLVASMSLMGCIPMTTAQVHDKAELIFENMVLNAQIDVENEGQPAVNILPKNLAENQIIKLSGRDIFNFDPAFAYKEDMFLSQQLFPGLTRMNPETNEFLPVLAEKWSVSDDQLTWTFNLNKNIPWVKYNSSTQNVEKLTNDEGEIRYVNAYDIKAGILRVLNPSSYGPNSFLLRNIVGVEDYLSETTDANAVGIETPNETQLVVR